MPASVPRADPGLRHRRRPISVGGTAGLVPEVRQSGTARIHLDRGAARRSRLLVGEWLAAWWPADVRHDPAHADLADRLGVVLSELVSNVVVHGHRPDRHDPGGPRRRPLDLELHRAGELVRLVLADPNTRPGETAESGRGLFIVDQLSDGRHAEPTSAGLVVWCDFVPRPAAC